MKALAERLPERVFSAAQVRELERRAIETCGVTDYELMCRAAAAALARHRPALADGSFARPSCAAPATTPVTASSLARLAQAAGRARERTARRAARAVQRRGGAGCGRLPCRRHRVVRRSRRGRSTGATSIVDALLGTGLARPVSDDFRAAIDAMNAAAIAGAGARPAERSRCGFRVAEPRGRARDGDRDVSRAEARPLARRRGRPLRRARVRGARATRRGSAPI